MDRAGGLAHEASAGEALRAMPQLVTHGRVYQRVRHPFAAVVEGLWAGLCQNRAGTASGWEGVRLKEVRA